MRTLRPPSPLPHRIKRRDHTGRSNAFAIRSRRMRNGAGHRTDDGRALLCLGAVGPDGDQPSDVVVNPLGAADSAFPLEAYLGGRSVGAGAMELQRPAIAADGALQKFRRGFSNDDGPVAEQ